MTAHELVTDHPPEVTDEDSDGRFRRAVDSVSTALALLSVLCIVAILLATVADVARRYFAGRSIAGVNEAGEVAMVAIVFLALGYAQRQRAHVSMTLVVRRLSRRGALLLNGAGLLVATSMMGWLLVVTFERALQSYQISEYRFGLVAIPVWPARAAIVVGVAVFVLELAFTLWDDVRASRRHAGNTDDISAKGV